MQVISVLKFFFLNEVPINSLFPLDMISAYGLTYHLSLGVHPSAGHQDLSFLRRAAI